MLRKAVAAALVTAALAAGVAYAGTGADGSTYLVSSYDGVTLVGFNDQGRTAGQFVTATSYVAAQLSKYIPGDPYKAACGKAAANYNGGLLVSTSDGGFLVRSAISSYASLGCKAKIVFNPSDPYSPGDPYRQIKSFQPVP